MLQKCSFCEVHHGSPLFHGLKIGRILIILLAFSVVAAGYLYRFCDIPFFRMDEGWDMEAPLEFLRTGQLSSPMLENGGGQSQYFHVHPPLFYLFVAAFYKSMGFGITPARLSAFLFGVLTLLVTALILKQQSPQKPYPFAFAFFSIAAVPLFFVLSKTVRPDMMLTFFFWSAYYCLLQWRVRQSPVWLLLGALSSGLMMLTHYYGLPIVILWLWEIIQRRAWKQGAAFLFIAGLTLLPYVAWVLESWSAFKAQVLVYRSFGEFKPLSRLAWMLWVLGSTLKSGLIAGMLLLGVILSLIRYPITHNSVLSDAMRLVGGFILQFAVLPRYNILYALLLVPLIPIIYHNLIPAYSQRFVYSIIAVFIALNSLGIGLYIWHHKDFSYDRYQSQLRSAVLPHYEFGMSILGSTSMYPIFHDLPYQAFESLYARHLTVEEIIRIVDRQQLILVDEYIPSRLNPLALEHITKGRECVGEILSPDYGSEGNHRNNIIRIYR